MKQALYMANSIDFPPLAWLAQEPTLDCIGTHTWIKLSEGHVLVLQTCVLVEWEGGKEGRTYLLHMLERCIAGWSLFEFQWTEIQRRFAMPRTFLFIVFCTLYRWWSFRLFSFCFAEWMCHRECVALYHPCSTCSFASLNGALWHLFEINSRK